MKNGNSYDLIVVGLGAMGAAALYQAAKRGLKVLGIDRFNPPHEMGSSHAETRFTRLAVGEGPAYVPLAARSHEIWRELEAQTDETIFYQNGLLIIAPNNPQKDEYNHWENFVGRSADVAAETGVYYETLSAEEVRAKSTKILITDDEHAGFEPTGGHVMIEKAIAIQLDLARKHGAEIVMNQPVLDVQSNEHGVRVKTAEGEYAGGQAIVSTGAWVNDFMPQRLETNFRVTRQIVFWFEVEDPEEYGPDKLPGILWVGERLEDYFAAFTLPPGSEPGLKVLTEQYVDATSPHDVQREISQEEIEAFYKKFGKTKIDGLSPNCLKACVCLYTHTPDDHFVIDWHPELESVMVVSACSSHGFKHSAAIGESLVETLVDGTSKIDLSFFKLNRLN